jgi:hypothetical protein
MERLTRALQAARGGPAAPDEAELLFDLRPYPFQEEILEQLAEERDATTAPRMQPHGWARSTA